MIPVPLNYEIVSCSRERFPLFTVDTIRSATMQLTGIVRSGKVRLAPAAWSQKIFAKWLIGKLLTVKYLFPADMMV
jgi:hypothetical protein